MPHAALPSLHGLRVIITRPQDYAQTLSQTLTAAGAEVACFPALTIGPPSDPLLLHQALARLARYHFALFVSRNAVAAVAQNWPGTHLAAEWPTATRIIAIGEPTARALIAADLVPAIVPKERFDSETLLQHPELQHLAGQQIVILRGNGGRELLHQEFRARGAQVTLVECYQRLPPSWPAAEFLALLTDPLPCVILITSGEGLDYLIDHLGTAAWPQLAQSALITGGRRLATLAAQRGFVGPILAASDPSDVAMLEALGEFSFAK